MTGGVVASLQSDVSAQDSEGHSFLSREQIWKEICERYDAAQSLQAASFTETNTEVYDDQGTSYILKIACKLRDKPKAPKDKNKGTWKNPFLPPDEDLYVGKLSQTHSLVLNKFNITPHHVIIITNDFKRQEEPLNRMDFAATWNVVTCMPGDGGMAFFNCGPISGASQPHKHIQCIPLPIAYDSEATALDAPFNSMIMNALDVSQATAFKNVVLVRELPFVHGVIKINKDETYVDRCLEEGYNAVLDFVEGQVKGYSSWTRTDSYNMIMTNQYMMIVPRNKEYIGSVGCNSMGFAGSFFLATQQEIDDVKKYGPSYLLSELGFKSQI